MMNMIIDCGTTNLRVTLTDEVGNVLARSSRPGGVRHTAIDGHNGRLKTMLRECIQEALAAAGGAEKDVSRCVASGMITSNVGLLEIPHLSAPVSAADLARGMRTETFPEIASFPISFIPGVRNFPGTVNAENFSDMDMMRGEEVEAVGLWELLKPEGDCLFILPGSHNKFVRMDARGRITGCMTSISGELLDAVTHHTILANAVENRFASAEEYDAAMVRLGAEECRRCGLGRAAFAGRILSQLGGEDSGKLRCFLLGAVLAQDVPALQAFLPENPKIYVAGKMPLRQALKDVLQVYGLPEPVEVPAEISEKMGRHGALTVASL